MMMRTNTELLKEAKKYIDAGGTIFRKYCGLGRHDPYCDAYVTYVFHEGEDALLFCDGKKQTSCPITIKWCYKNLACIPIYLAMPMDIIFFDWEANGVPNHIGFVHKRKSTEEIYTIEGNTSKTDKNNHVIATGVVAYKTRTLYNEKRTIKYIQGVFRPHFPAKFDANKKLVVDGQLGYNTIAVMQKWLNIKVDGILGLGTLKTLQRKLGVTADGIWGNGTSKALQKLIGTEADGYFGENSVKALQTYLNKQVFEPKPQPKPQPTTQDKIVAWAKKIASDNSWHYVKWSSNKKTHECPICHDHAKGKYHGWNCIGFAFACWHHGGGIKCKCNCSVINDDEWNKIYKAKTDAKALKIAKDLIGINDIAIIRNKKGIPQSQLKAGDICARADKEVEHIFLYIGDGKMADCRGSNGKVPNDNQISVRKAQVAKIAIRYTGK